MRPEIYRQRLAQGAPERTPDDWETWDRRENSPHFPVRGRPAVTGEALTATGRARSHLCAASQDAAGRMPLELGSTSSGREDRRKCWGMGSCRWKSQTSSGKWDGTRYAG